MNDLVGIRTAIQQFLNDLEKIAAEYEEFTDTEVREALHRALTNYFVWGAARDRLPVTYYMFSAEGDKLVSSAVARFLQATSDEVAGIPPGKPRLDLLQDEMVRTTGGMQYWELYGYRDDPLPLDSLPAEMFVAGDYELGDHEQ